MRNVWIEVKTESNTCQKVAKELRSFSEIKEADALFGNVDVLVLAKIDDKKSDYLDAVEELIRRIKKTSGVVTTVTRIVKRPEN